MRELGRSGLRVSALGLGCIGLTSPYGPPGEGREMIALVRAAAGHGAAHFDTAGA